MMLAEESWPYPQETIGKYPHALLFSSYNGARYLFDSATSTIHPWPWNVDSSNIGGLYETPNEQLPAYLDRVGTPRDLTRYILLWRAKAGAFGRPLCHSHGDGRTTCGPPELKVERERLSAWSKERHLKQPPPIQFALPTMFGNLMLVVTDACNLRCRYCLLGGGYSGFKPLRSKHMSWEVAKRAVDHFIAMNDSVTFQAMHDRKINISFFGGEPLLRGDLIKRVVDYSKALEKSGCGYWIDYALTTNLIHLQDGLAAFLVERDIGLQVSIDGPQQVHDLYRVNAAGRGGFALTRRNLEKLRSINPDYFARRVRSVVTLNGNSDLLAINEFFESGDPVIPGVSFVSVIRDFERSEFHRTFPYDAKRLWEQYSLLMTEYLRRKGKGVPVVKGQFLYHLFEEPLRVLNGRVMHPGTPTRPAYTGTCQPGRRLAVSTDGKFHVCERINEHFPIGDVQTGVDLGKCAELLCRYYESLPDCDRCWARPVCNTCMAHNCENDKFKFGARCDHIRTELVHKLRLLCTVLENRPDALDTNDPLVDRVHMLEVPK